jgi:Predicted esterase
MKNFKRFILTALLCVPILFVVAREPVKVPVKSDAMGVEINNLVILPDTYDVENAIYPVVYLLHGFGGNENMWYHMRGDLTDLATKYKMIFVLPDGGKSWYWDAPKNPKSKYETYITRELLPYVDKNFRTIKDRKARAITGLSMGGHGALFLALKHPDLFGACGSTSGGMDIRPFSKQWTMEESLGKYEENQELWTAHTVAGNIDVLEKANLAIIIDCGFDDFFFAVNEAFHAELLLRKIPHDYLTRPGSHSVDYWKNSIDYHLLFFKKFFDKK